MLVPPFPDPKILHAGSVEVEGDGSSNLAVGETQDAEWALWQSMASCDSTDLTCAMPQGRATG